MEQWEFIDRWEGDDSIEDVQVLTDSKYIFWIHKNGLITIFDPSTKKVSPTLQNPYLASSHFAGHFSTVLMDVKIYIINAQETIITTVITSETNIFVLDIATQSSSQAPSLPVPFNAFATVDIGDRWILVTGLQYDNGVEYKNLYDTYKQTWTDEANMAAFFPPRLGYRCLKVESHIVTMRGYNDYPMTAMYMKHVIAGWIWKTLKPYVMLRNLLDEMRVAPIHIATDYKLKCDDDADIKSKFNTHEVVQKVFIDIHWTDESGSR